MGRNAAGLRTPATPWTHVERVVLAGLGFSAGLVVAGLGKQLMQPDKSVNAPVTPEYEIADEQFLRAVGSVLPPLVLPGNRITTLVNGVEIFPAMLEAIRSAQRTITFETFIYWSGRIGRMFADALSERARAGVRCHVLLDWFGSKKLDASSIERMQAAGVEVVRYHRRWWQLSRLNHRTHRKLLVVDGQTGFTGGVGIADEWDGDAEDEHHWRDNHYRIEGPAVAQLQSAFTDNWLKRQHVVLHDEGYFPRLDARGELLCQGFQSSPDEGSESMRLMVLMSLAAARHSVRIATAYFVPDRVTMDALIQARRRGARVEILLPGPHIDLSIVRQASRHHWGELVESGLEIYEYVPSMFHWKAMILDELWTSIGSANFDNRSFRINDEANLNVYDRGFARQQIELFERDKSRARPVTLARLARRPTEQKIADAAAATVSSQL